MSNILVIDDEKHICMEWESLLFQNHHKCTYALNIDEALEYFNSSLINDDEFDLILLDHNLGDETGIDFIQDLQKRELPKDYLEHKIIVITGHGSIALAKEYASTGVVGHLIKPVSTAQFQAAIEAALERRRIYIEERENWQSAYNLLEDLGLLESVDQLKSDSQQIAEQYDALKQTYEQLLADLGKAGSKEHEISQAYQKAYETLNSTYTGIESILNILENFQITKSLWSDIQNIFKTDKLQFFILQAYLKRISATPNTYRVKHLVGGATGHYEYRIGRNYRLYFRRDGYSMILERFGQKKHQDKIIQYLNNYSEECISLKDLDF